MRINLTGRIANPHVRKVFTEQMRRLMRKGQLTKKEMHKYVLGDGEYKKKGFEARLREYLDSLEAPTEDIPASLFKMSGTTVLRWMHACNAVYGKHVKS